MKNKLLTIIIFAFCIFINMKTVFADPCQSYDAYILQHSDEDVIDYIISYHGLDGKININNIVEFDNENLELMDVYIPSTSEVNYNVNTNNQINISIVDNTTEEETVTIVFKMLSPEEKTTITLKETNIGEYAFINSGEKITFDKYTLYDDDNKEEQNDNQVSAGPEETKIPSSNNDNKNIIIYFLSGLIIVLFIEILLLSKTNGKLRKNITNK